MAEPNRPLLLVIVECPCNVLARFSLFRDCFINHKTGTKMTIIHGAVGMIRTKVKKNGAPKEMTLNIVLGSNFQKWILMIFYKKHFKLLSSCQEPISENFNNPIFRKSIVIRYWSWENRLTIRPIGFASKNVMGEYITPSSIFACNPERNFVFSLKRFLFY